jgi:glycosyltransferase involved in cell wall biosynthesis
MVTELPTFSVITPVFNGEKFIEETIKSVLNACEGLHYEYIVVNDGSTDETQSILELFSDAIRVISQQNRGESESVNVGINATRGEYLIVVSADDPLLGPEIFIGVEERFLQDSNLVAIYPDWQIIDSAGAVLEIKHLPDFTVEDFLAKNLVLPGPGTIFRREAAIKIGGRRSKWRFVGDYDFWLRLSDEGKFLHRNCVLAQWRHHGESTSVSARGPQMAEERIAVISDYLNNTSSIISKQVRRIALANAYALASRLVFFSADVPGKKYFIKSLLLRRSLPERLRLVEGLYILLHPLSKVLVYPIRNRIAR